MGQELHLFPDFYDGVIEEYFPNGRDSVFLPSPCFQTTINIHSGASGGPVFDEHGKVCGINSTSFDGEKNLSFISRIVDILHLRVTDICIPGQSKNSFSIAELADLGHVSFDTNGFKILLEKERTRN
jgi:hypothetical protein